MDFLSSSTRPEIGHASMEPERKRGQMVAGKVPMQGPMITAGDAGRPLDFWQRKTPCWEMCHCPETIKNDCPATRYRSSPCWEIEGTYLKLSIDGKSGRDTRICYGCRVYKRWGEDRPIVLTLLGKGLDSWRRSLEKRAEELGECAAQQSGPTLQSTETLVF